MPVLLEIGRHCSELFLIRSMPLTKIKPSPVQITNSTGREDHKGGMFVVFLISCTDSINQHTGREIFLCRQKRSCPYLTLSDEVKQVLPFTESKKSFWKDCYVQIQLYSVLLQSWKDSSESFCWKICFFIYIYNVVAPITMPPGEIAGDLLCLWIMALSLKVTIGHASQVNAWICWLFRLMIFSVISNSLLLYPLTFVLVCKVEFKQREQDDALMQHYWG